MLYNIYINFLGAKMSSSAFVKQHKSTILIIAFLVISLLILIPGINKYVHEYNAMNQELNRLGVKIDTISIEPSQHQKLTENSAIANKDLDAAFNKEVDIANQKLSTQSTTTAAKQITDTNQPQHITEKTKLTKITQPNSQLANTQPAQTIDYKPLENAIDSAIGVEDIGTNSPFAAPSQIVKTTKPTIANQKKLVQHPEKTIAIQKKIIKNNKNPIITKKSITAPHKIYAIQLASFKNKQSAYTLQAKLLSQKLKATVQKNKNMYRVFVLPKNNTKIATTTLQKQILKQYKINGYIKKIKN